MGKKNKQAKNNKSNKLNNNPLLFLDMRPFIWLALVLLLLLSPVMRGLFFEPDLMLSFFFAAVLALLVAADMLLRRSRLRLNLFDAAVFALVLAYLAAIIGAVDSRGALVEVLKYLQYALVFFVVAYLVRSLREMQAVIAILYSATVLVAALGVLAATGLLPFPAAFDGRAISSTLQYPNTLASYLVAGFVLGLGLWSISGSIFLRLFAAAGNFLLLLVIFNTFSRGTWLLIPFLLLLFLLLLPRRELLKNVYFIFLVTAISFLVGRSFIPALVAADIRKVAYLIILGLALACAGAVLYEFITRAMAWWDAEERSRRVLINSILVFMIINIGAYIYYAFATLPALSGQVMPRRLIEYTQTARPGDLSFESRLDMKVTALRIFRDHPLIGIGGRGWAARYHQYQPLLFYTTEVHNHYLQVLVEAGIFGFLAFAAIWGFFLVTLYRLFPRPRDALEEEEEGQRRWILAWTAGVAALGMGLHSALDFDLSLPAMAIFLWSLLAVVRGPMQLAQHGPSAMLASPARFVPSHALPAWTRYGEMAGDGEGETEEILPAVRFPYWGASVSLVLVALLLIVPAYRFRQAGQWGAKGAQLLEQGELFAADEHYRRAVQLDPLQATFRADLAQLYVVAGLNEGDQILIEKAHYQAAIAAALKPYDPVIASMLINVYQLLGENDKAIAKAASLLTVNPLNITNYELVMELNFVQALALLAQARAAEARLRAEAILDAGTMLEENIVRLTRLYPVGPIYWTGRMLYYSDRISLRVAQARMILDAPEPAPAPHPVPRPGTHETGALPVLADSPPLPPLPPPHSPAQADPKDVLRGLAAAQPGGVTAGAEIKKEALIWLAAAAYLDGGQAGADALLAAQIPAELADQREHIAEEASWLVKLLAADNVP
jgi:O-antigen ligase/tetratricopeptide (TPR) repeat protein